jgi:hypothetical protein
MTISERVLCLTSLRKDIEDLSNPVISDVINKAKTENPWFTVENTIRSLAAIRDQFLTESAIGYMLHKYHLDDNIVPKKIGLILAGNIPLVGFHDVLCCFLSGHYSMIKYSDKDTVLMKFMVESLISYNTKASLYFSQVDKLTDFDAAIVTGSNNTARHFEYYLRHVPHLIRQNRNSIAVLSGLESSEELSALGLDVFSYFGLGCRNVSKIFLPKGYEIRNLFIVFEEYIDIIHHNKYKNNYDYNVALFLLNKENFLHNDMLILKESDQIISRIGSLHYQFYDEINVVSDWVIAHKTDIQCVLSSMHIPGVDTIHFGQGQSPEIDTYADDIDTMQFLLSI